MESFDLEPEIRADLWQRTIEQLEAYYAHTKQLPVAPTLDAAAIADLAHRYDFSTPLPAAKAVEHVIEALRTYQVHTPHPSYYGLFNPRTTFPSILGDLITATFNPQLAAWSHSPFAAEVEKFLIREFARQFGFPQPSIDGVCCSGGAEANQTAVLCALNHHFPDFSTQGLRGLPAQPVLYCSADAHHSVAKAARSAGLGLSGVRNIPMDEQLRMDASLLEKQITADRKKGLSPFLVVATAGTTGPGAIDPLPEIADLCERYQLWLHTDAAYGGALALHPDLRSLLEGIERSHSITFDVHKWLSVPMGASLFLTRDPEILHRSFRISADYMPQEARAMAVVDPYTHSIQWSRRFIGLKLYLPMLVFGWEGMQELVARQIRTGKYLKDQLRASGWRINNPTPLPIACFDRPEWTPDSQVAAELCRKVVESGKAWISTYPVKGRTCLRACVTNYATGEQEAEALVDQLNS